jgi:hypothetical protein
MCRGGLGEDIMRVIEGFAALEREESQKQDNVK